ncbi:MAG: glycoside hydrolase family 19 protein [Aquabacterium sp.]
MGLALTLDHLLAADVPPTLARRYIDPLRAACALHGIDTAARLAGFLGNAIVETSGLVRIEENLVYSSPKRIATIFRSRFDLDGDRKISPAEIEFARGYVRQPQKLANRAYAGKNGNGNEASGDGWRFRGRGIFQLTGRAWYERAGRELGRPYLEQPDLLLQPDDAALSAAWYWSVAGCNALADRRDLDGITKAINGPAMLEKERRRREINNMLAILAGKV